MIVSAELQQNTHTLRVFPSSGLSHRAGSVDVTDGSIAGRQGSHVVLAGLQSAMKVKSPGQAGWDCSLPAILRFVFNAELVDEKYDESYQ